MATMASTARQTAMMARRLNRSESTPLTRTSASAGSELHQPDEAEVERIAGQVVDLPADRDAHHERGEGRREARRPEEAIAAMAKRTPAGFGCGRGVHSRLLLLPRCPLPVMAGLVPATHVLLLFLGEELSVRNEALHPFASSKNNQTLVAGASPAMTGEWMAGNRNSLGWARRP